MFLSWVDRQRQGIYVRLLLLKKENWRWAPATSLAVLSFSMARLHDELASMQGHLLRHRHVSVHLCVAICWDPSKFYTVGQLSLRTCRRKRRASGKNFILHSKCEWRESGNTLNEINLHSILQAIVPGKSRPLPLWGKSKLSAGMNKEMPYLKAIECQLTPPSLCWLTPDLVTSLTSTSLFLQKGYLSFF